MQSRWCTMVGAAMAGVACVWVPAAAQTPAPVTPWGTPDLQGVWDFRSLTPMERPEDLADQERFTTEEAATFSEAVIRRESRTWLMRKPRRDRLVVWCPTTTSGSIGATP